MPNDRKKVINVHPAHAGRVQATSMVAAVVPHGVLFRAARKEDSPEVGGTGLDQAVIGLPQNLFYGATIPACILVRPESDRKPQTGVAKCLHQCRRRISRRPCSGYLRPKRRKIVSTFDRFENVPAALAP